MIITVRRAKYYYFQMAHFVGDEFIATPRQHHPDHHPGSARHHPAAVHSA
jgi:hypothetical protein